MLKPSQNLRDEAAMDVDEDKDGTQQVQDYSIEVDFSGLDDEEREASLRRRYIEPELNHRRLTTPKRSPNLTHRFPN